MAKYDDLNTKQIFIVGIASVMVTVVTILAVQYVYYLLVDGYQEQLQAESSYNRQNQVLNDQLESVSRYGVDPESAQVTIPVEKAMELVAKKSNPESGTNEEKSTEKDET
jgi:hypothetical protein